ncbi:MAG: TetR/AcrR family transcriptional regulator [Spirochaetaceae bacterium]
MPRGFTDIESNYYRNRLLEVGSDLFSKGGLTGVSIDQIVKEVGISKGSFYKFFKNKEDLCYDCLMKLENDTRAGIEEQLSKYKHDPALLLKMVITDIPQIIEKHPLISIFQKPQDLEALMLRVDPKKHEDNYNGDSLFLGRLLSESTISTSEQNSLTALIWAIVLMSFNKDFFNGQFDNIVNLLADMAQSHFSDRRISD